MQVIEQLIKKKFSLIPLQSNSKLPVAGLRWKPYQYKRATIEEVLNWYMNFGNINIGVITGRISRLVVIDVDDERQLLELLKVIPDLFNTCYVRTKRGYHFYFFIKDDIRSTSSLFGLDGIELKAKGRYVVSAGSVVDGFRYRYERSLTNILPVPEVITERQTVIPGITGDITEEIELPRYRGQASCIGQIAREDIPENTVRHIALLILYNKLIEAGNSKEYARYFIERKNSQLTTPLPKKDINFEKADIYHYSCPRINEELDFVDCSFCKVRGGLKVESIAMRSIHKLKGLTNSERGILLTLDTYFKGLVGEELPTIYEIQKYSDTKMNYYTIKNALEVLKEKGII